MCSNEKLEIRNQNIERKMKKTFITLCAVLIASVSMAAGHVDSVRYLTTKAGQNWFISADGNVDWWQG